MKEEINSESSMSTIVVNEDYSMDSVDQFVTGNNLYVAVDDTNEFTMHIRSMMRKEDGRTGWVCHVCGKTAQKSNIAQHIESKHMEGVSYTLTTAPTVAKSASLQTV